MWAVIVVLPAVQAEFGADRAGASLPYTLMMLGFGVGGIFMGRLADRRGISCRSLLSARRARRRLRARRVRAQPLVFALAHGMLHRHRAPVGLRAA